MHTVVVDITIQGDSAKASASHFHTVVPFHNLLTIWFSFGQTVLRSAFRVIGIIPSLSLLMYSQVILFGRETRPLLFSKNCLIGGACNTHLHHSVLRKQRKHFAVRTGLEPVTSAVVADMGFEPIREVLNIHLARLLASRLSTIRQSASDLSGLLLYTGQHSNQLN